MSESRINDDERVTRSTATEDVRLRPSSESSGADCSASSLSPSSTTENDCRVTYVPHNSPRVSITRPPDYATLCHAIDDQRRDFLKAFGCTHDARIHITPPSRTTIVHGPPPLVGAPPTYSAIMRIGPTEMAITRGRRPVRIQPSPPFIAPRPPPSYAEADGNRNCLDRSALEEHVFTNQPVRLICPSCLRMITTTTYTHRSNLTHFSAIVLFVCGCWPCCFVPYCMKSCKSTDHYCPDCETHLGMHTPW